MARLVFGYDPPEITVVLAWGGGWAQSFYRADSPFDDGDQVLMKFYVTDDEDAVPAATWAATLNGQSGAWVMGPDDVLEVLHAKAKFVRVYLVPASAPSSPIPWAVGNYVRK